MDLESLQRLADEDLMPLVERKDPAAFEIAYDRHGGAAYSLAYRIVGDKAIAEDVTLEPEGGSKQPTSQPMLQAEA